MNGDVIYKNYKNNILSNKFDIYYKAFSEANDLDEISSIIRCIDEKNKLHRFEEPSLVDKGYLDTLNIGNKDITYSSYKISHYLCEKYKEYSLNHLFIITLYFRHNTICQYLNTENKYNYKLDHYVRFFDICDELKESVYFNYGLYLLNRQLYKHSYTYTIYLNPVKASHLNICPENMRGFQKGDKHKTLLVYMSGGIGDNIMYSRFMNKMIDVDNHIIFLIYDELYWIYEHIYKDCKYITTMKYSKKHQLSHFDYHVNVSRLYVLLQLDYNDIYIDYFPTLPYYKLNKDDYLSKEKQNIIIHWKGNPQNEHEEHNRQIKLELLVPLLQRPNIQFISIMKDITPQESELLKKYNVIHLDLDKHECFRHSMELILSVDSVITTDTSLSHLCGTLGVNCCTLLSAGCDWRWGKEPTTLWYPKMKLMRQSEPFDWSKVVEKLVVIPIHR